jgi:2-polyprenyl-3-methyl-5-hydroxy-6-metoxy-1,4-benzoquinol methylase
MSCDDCTHVFTEGYYHDEALNLIFGSTQDIQVVGNQMEGQRHVSARMIEKCLPYAKSGNWLDVGFGNGSLLFTAQEFGFNVHGLDLRETSVSAIQRLGIPADQDDITEFETDQKFDVISMMDVLEHMPFPRLGLQAAFDLMNPGGVLFVSMPNSDSPAWKDLDRQNLNPYWGEIEHYHNFGRTTLYGLLQEFGFKPVKYGISERYRVSMEVIAVREN